MQVADFTKAFFSRITFERRKLWEQFRRHRASLVMTRCGIGTLALKDHTQNLTSVKIKCSHDLTQVGHVEYYVLHHERV